jgi:molybdate transport system regulatory protein
MQLSARNQLPGAVTGVKEGAVMAEVTIQLDNGPEVVSVITVDSVRRLKLAAGSRVTVVIKATEVMVATDSGA